MDGGNQYGTVISTAIVGLTVSAGLYGGLDIADALDGDTVLVVAVDEQILELTDLVDQDTELVRHVRHVLIAGLAPDGQLLLEHISSPAFAEYWELSHTATSMRSRATSSMLRMTFFSILTSCDSFRARSGPKAPAVFLRNA